jgi:hypothetical protein
LRLLPPIVLNDKITVTPSLHSLLSVCATCPESCGVQGTQANGSGSYYVGTKTVAFLVAQSRPDLASGQRAFPPSWPQLPRSRGRCPCPFLDTFAWGKVPLRPWFSLPPSEPRPCKMRLFVASTLPRDQPSGRMYPMQYRPPQLRQGAYEFCSKNDGWTPRKSSRVPRPAAGIAVITRRKRWTFSD